MATFGYGDFRCECCKHFDTDGIDGNHPQCEKQIGFVHRAIWYGHECPYGYEPGVPTGYPVHMERNERRAKEVMAMIDGLEAVE